MQESSELSLNECQSFVLEASEEEWIKRAMELIKPLLDDAARVQAFKGRWMMICMRLRLLSEVLDYFVQSSSLQQSFLYHKSALPQIVSSLLAGRELAQRCIDLRYSGKLQMQSKLDALVTNLDFNLRDLGEVKLIMNQNENSLVISTSLTSAMNAAENHKKEQVSDMFRRLRGVTSTEMKKLIIGSLIDYISNDNQAASFVADEGDVGHLVHMLDSSSPAISEMATDAVFTIAMSGNQGKKAISCAGVISPLLRVLEFGNLHAKERASLTLFELSSTAEDVHAVASQAGAISLLVRLCTHGSPGIVMGAVGTLYNLTRNKSASRAMVDNGAFDTLICLLSCNYPHARHYAAKALQALASSKDDSIRSCILMHGGMQSLLSFLKQAKSVEAQEIVIQALGMLATSPANVKSLVSAGYVVCLTELLNSTASSRIQQLVAMAIRDLASHMDLKGQAFPAPLKCRLLEAQELPDYWPAAPALSGAFLVKKNHHQKGDTSTVGILNPFKACKRFLTKKLSMSALLFQSSYKNRIMSGKAKQQLHAQNTLEVNSTRLNRKEAQKLTGKKLLSMFPISSNKSNNR
ncbi:hypothetical protein KP509_01G050200 [Ceratopteris richardii]|uniref:DUF7032 domain-containing protein n=1 Tax=Ceratopteris richardii TaxID=49495 RepID=A0A8T2VCS1_CERRI|nr:hypothetical protein KP509_01G050200 [Ceratopteris richardii]